MHYETYSTDLLCIGAGLAGERVAIEVASQGFEAVLLSLVPPRRSHSCAAEGGMQASLGNMSMSQGDSPKLHFEDTVKGSDWGCDQEVARIFCQTAPVAAREAAFWGVPWNRVVAGPNTYFQGGESFEMVETPESNGLITARNFGGTSKWRACYTADGTGHTLLYAMDSKVLELGIKVHDRVEATSLIHDGQRCMGCVGRDLRTGKLRIYLAKATLIATGGYGRLYPETTSNIINEGGGHIIALDTGLVPFGNPEAVQFHPTGIVPTNILVTEGCRGEGGTLLDVDKHRFMPDYEPGKAELASRDVVARWMTHHIAEGKGVNSPYGDHLWLDIRHLGAKNIRTKLREVYELCHNFLGIDCTKQLIPVRPAQHYSMGGMRINKNGAAYGLENLFLAGESACWDLHGFNRLAGNSLAETIVAGRHVGGKVAQFLAGHENRFSTVRVQQVVMRDAERIHRLVSGNGGKENVYAIRSALQREMMDRVGIFRDGKGLAQAVDNLCELYARSLKIGLRSSGIGANPELALALKVPGMIRLALCVAYAALMRTESRGSHSRADYPARNDRDWLTRTLAYWPDPGADLPELKYETASKILDLPPGDRGYGKTEIISMDAPPEV
ncbi:fumarate reductase flavoprotein subunit [Desulfoferula mesophila]|uniref:succinate dehydrogenase n=1 Tax=Desulfoferula mesophila TaxID=3058419 RepID=A0AAU9EC83_9BACT|nr:fumarate reductase flavoprotein subunit [Desulfoferula mesophilus]